MPLVELADWSVLGVAVAVLVALAGGAVGKVIALMHRVDMLEDWFGQVRWELLAREQADEFALMCERMQNIENELNARGDRSGQAAA
jgi:hypothetical protein